jgi:hypothetical protein
MMDMEATPMTAGLVTAHAPAMKPATAAPPAGSAAPPAGPATRSAGPATPSTGPATSSTGPETSSTGLAEAELRQRRQAIASSLRPLLLDVALPVGTYYALHSGFGLSLWISLAASSVVPAIRTIAAIVVDRQLNFLAMLMLIVNLAGIAVSFATGDPRMMIAKDSVVSSVIAIAILVSVAARRPLMSAALKPFMVRGSAQRSAAWDRLADGSARFRRLQAGYSVIWGLALLAECVTRLVGAFTLPVPTMVWLGTVLTLAAIGLAIFVSGAVAAAPIEQMIEAEAS